MRPRITFPIRKGFREALDSRVDSYFAERHAGKHGEGTPMLLKSALIASWVLGSYLFVLLAPVSAATRLMGCVVYGLGIAAFVFNIGHDGNHGAYSDKPWLNRLTGMSFDLIGVSSFLWRFRHNVVHHTYTNIAGVDCDMSSAAPFLRLNPTDPYYPFHRFQHVYAWFLYSLVATNWLFRDASALFGVRKYCMHDVPKPARADYAAYFLGKAVLIGYLLVLPLWMGFSMLQIFIGLAAAYLTTGLLVAVTFQLAHIVERSEVMVPAGPAAEMSDEWAIHQLKTCTDFAPTNRIVSWFLGGLNFQAVHHLYPDVCHLHYPGLSRIVAEVADQHGVEYRVYSTMTEALAAHYRVMRRLGRQKRDGDRLSTASVGQHVILESAPNENRTRVSALKELSGGCGTSRREPSFYAILRREIGLQGTACADMGGSLFLPRNGTNLA
jgi:linoleoyl-CoA desaturase